MNQKGKDFTHLVLGISYVYIDFKEKKGKKANWLIEKQKYMHIYREYQKQTEYFELKKIEEK